MNNMDHLRSALSAPAARPLSRSRSRSPRERRIRSLEATVADMASRVESLEGSAAALRAKITTLERDKNFWRRFFVGLWNVFNGHRIESMAPSNSQSSTSNWNGADLQAAADDDEAVASLSEDADWNAAELQAAALASLEDAEFLQEDAPGNAEA